MCRKECVEAAKPLLPEHAGAEGQQLSYEEFCEEVQLQIAIHESAEESQGVQVVDWPQAQTQTQSPGEKKSICGAILLIAIVAAIITFVLVSFSNVWRTIS